MNLMSWSSTHEHDFVTTKVGLWVYHTHPTHRFSVGREQRGYLVFLTGYSVMHGGGGGERNKNKNPWT